MSAQPALTLPQPVHTLDFGALAALVARAMPGIAMLACDAMTGGASTRRYFRVGLARDGNGTPATLVAMFVPEGPKAEEVDKGGAGAAAAAAGRKWPFLEVRDL